MSATAGAAIATGMAAAAGSVVGQGVGIAVGVQDKFSWKSVALAGIGAGVTAGLAGAAGAAGAGANGGLFGIKSPYVEAAVRQATSNVVTQGVAIAAGLQEKFDWRSVAVSAVAAPISKYLTVQFEGSALGQTLAAKFGDTGRDIATGIVTGTATQLVRMQVYGGGKIDWATVAADAFGNAIGNAITKRMAARDAQQFARNLETQGGEAIRPMLRRAGVSAEQQDEWIKQSGTPLAEAYRAQRTAERKYGMAFDDLPLEVQAAELAPLYDRSTHKSLQDSPLTKEYDRQFEAPSAPSAVSPGEVIYSGPPLEPVVITGRRYEPTWVETAASLLDAGARGLNKIIDWVGEGPATAAVFGVQLALGGLPRTLVSMAAGALTQDLRDYGVQQLSGLLQEQVFDGTGDPYAVKRVSDTLAAVGVEFVLGSASSVVRAVSGYGSVQRMVAGNRAMSAAEQTARKDALALDLAKRIDGDSSRLGRAMQRAGIVVPQGHAAHHLIGGEMAKRYPDLFEMAAKHGYDINGPSNGLALPTSRGLSEQTGLPLHSGRHLDEYTGAVRRELVDLETLVKSGKVSPAELPGRLDAISLKMEEQLLSRSIFLQKNDPYRKR